jgi:Zn-dependent protease
MSGNACLKCGSPATKTYTLYDPNADVQQDVPLCESCYSSYTPVLKKGKLVWKRSGLVTYYPPFFFAIGSRRAAEAASRFLDRLVGIRLFRKLIKAIPYVLVALSVIGSGFLIYSLVWQMANAEVLQRTRPFYRQHPLAGIGVVGIDPLLPLAETLIALFFAVTLHELAHAFILRVYGYEIRKVGVFFMGPIPAGAFVEPPGSVERKMRPREALELVGAGIYTNLIIAGIALAVYLWLLSGLRPQNPEALTLLTRAWNNPVYLFVPPLMFSMLNVPSPTYPPEGWFVHSWLGTSFAFPMSVLHHAFFLNFWLAVMNSLPIRPLDGGYIVPALVRGRTGYRLSMIITTVLLIVLLIPVVLFRFL